MNRPFLTCFCLLVILSSAATDQLFSQQDYFNWRIGGGYGILSYEGDLSAKVFDKNQIQTGYHVAIQKKLSPSFMLSLGYEGGKLGADQRDQPQSGGFGSNAAGFKALNFRTEFHNIGLSFIYQTDNDRFFDKKTFVSPYLIGGVGLIVFDVYGDLLNSEGERYFYWSDFTIRNIDESAPNASEAVIVAPDNEFETELRPLNTELNEPYKQASGYAEFGLGLKFRISNRFNLNLSSVARYAFTDHLDDVSNRMLKDVYPDEFNAYAADPAGTITGTRGKDNQWNDIFTYSSVALFFNFGKERVTFSGPVLFAVPDLTLDEGLAPPVESKPDQLIIESTSSDSLIDVPDREMQLIGEPVPVAEVELIKEPTDPMIRKDTLPSAGDLARVDEVQVIQVDAITFDSVRLEQQEFISRDTLPAEIPDSISLESIPVSEVDTIVFDTVDVATVDSLSFDSVLVDVPDSMVASALEPPIPDTGALESAQVMETDSLSLDSLSVDQPVAMPVDTTKPLLPATDTSAIKSPIPDTFVVQRIDTIVMQIEPVEPVAVPSAAPDPDTVKVISRERGPDVLTLDTAKLNKQLADIQSEIGRLQQQDATKADQELTNQKIDSLKVELQQVNQKLSNIEISQATEVSPAPTTIREGPDWLDAALLLELRRLNSEMAALKSATETDSTEALRARVEYLEAEVEQLSKRAKDEVDTLDSPSGSNDSVQALYRKQIELLQLEVNTLKVQSQRSAGVDVAGQDNERFTRMQREMDSLKTALNILQLEKMDEKEAYRKLVDSISAAEKIRQDEQLQRKDSMDRARTEATEMRLALKEYVEAFGTYQIFFGFNQAFVPANAHPKLEEVAELLKSNADLRLTIKGFADPSGNAQYNMVLSERRANSVSDYLTKSLGVYPPQIYTIPVGEVAYEQGRTDNSYFRRVDLYLSVVK